MTEQAGSRIAAAKQRAADVKRTLVVGAAAAFVGVIGLAWASHPGSSSATSGTSDATSEDQDQGFFFGEDDDDFEGFPSSSIAPSGESAPQAQTHVS